jgi:hypothetical protein
MVWDPKTKLVSPQVHVMFNDNFDTVQPPDANIKHADTMDGLFRNNIYTYDDPFGNDHPYLFSHGGADIHPDDLAPTIETRLHQQTPSCTQTKKDLLDKNPGTIHPSSDNLITLHKTHDPTYLLPFTNAHVFPKNPWPFTKKR